MTAKDKTVDEVLKMEFMGFMRLSDLTTAQIEERLTLAKAHVYELISSKVIERKVISPKMNTIYTETFIPLEALKDLFREGEL